MTFRPVGVGAHQGKPKNLRVELRVDFRADSDHGTNRTQHPSLKATGEGNWFLSVALLSSFAELIMLNSQ